jgi:hypothetical protein
LGCCRRGVAKEFSKRCVRHNEIGVLHCDCIVLREGLQRRASHARLYFAICQSEVGFGNMCCRTEIAELAETDAVNFACDSPSAVIEFSVGIFRRRVQEENTLPPATRS